MPPFHPSIQRRKRLVIWLSTAVFLLQALVPAGFMPAPLSSGQFVQLCPTGLTPELMRLFHPGHGGNSPEPIDSAVFVESPEPIDSPEPTGHMHHHAHHAGHHQMADMQPVASEHSEHRAHSDSGHDDSMSWRADCPFGAVAPADHALRLALTPFSLAAPDQQTSDYQPQTRAWFNTYLSPPARAPPKAA